MFVENGHKRLELEFVISQSQKQSCFWLWDITVADKTENGGTTIKLPWIPKKDQNKGTTSRDSVLKL